VGRARRTPHLPLSSLFPPLHHSFTGDFRFGSGGEPVKVFGRGSLFPNPLFPLASSSPPPAGKINEGFDNSGERAHS